MPCEYCQSLPHLPGCPNEPETEEVCKRCGKPYEQAFNGICVDCLDKLATIDHMKDFALENAEEFLWYSLGIKFSYGAEDVRKIISTIAIEALEVKGLICFADYRTFTYDYPDKWSDWCDENY